MKLSAQEELAAQAIGLEIMTQLKQEDCLKRIALETQTKALQILEEVRHILNDDSLDDHQCFRRIDAIVNVFSANGMDTSRHDW